MAIYLLVTSALLANLYHKFCKLLHEADFVCDSDEKKFLVLPVFGFLTTIGWVRLLHTHGFF